MAWAKIVYAPLRGLRAASRDQGDCPMPMAMLAKTATSRCSNTLHCAHFLSRLLLALQGARGPAVLLPRRL